MIHKNMGLRRSVQVARELGGQVELGCGGEVIFTAPGMPKVRVHNDGDNTNQKLVSWLRRLQKKS